MADGVITPAITVTSAIEGLKLFNPGIPVVIVVLVIITVLFAVQQFGTSFLGKSFGPIMFFWFSMLGVLGVSQIITFPEVLLAVNPHYAAKTIGRIPQRIRIAWCRFPLYYRS